MRNQLVLVLLLLLIVAMVMIRTVVRVRTVNRMRSKPRPDRLKPAVPIMVGVLVVAVFGIQATQVPADVVPSVLLLGVGSLLAGLAATFFTSRDLRTLARRS